MATSLRIPSIPEKELQLTNIARQFPRPMASLEYKEGPIPEFHLDDLEYVTNVDEHLICPICRVPCIVPIELECDHIFCQKCIISAFAAQESREIAPTCPTCRNPSSSRSCRPVSKVIYRMLNDLKVKCPRSDRGCEEVLSRSSVSIHLRNYCAYQDVYCPLRKCDQLVPRGLANETCLHKLRICTECGESTTKLSLLTNHGETCKQVDTSCGHCAQPVPKGTYETHKKVCPERKLPCAAAYLGCPFRGKKEEVAVHLRSCYWAAIAEVIEKQTDVLRNHEKMIEDLQARNITQEATLNSIMERLAIIPSDNSNPSHSEPSGQRISDLFDGLDRTSFHLLSLHDNLRDEVAEVSTAVTNLTARTELLFHNARLRSQEENAARDNAIAAMRTQLHRLLVTRTTDSSINRIGNGSSSRSQVAAAAVPGSESTAGPVNSSGCEAGPSRPPGGGQKL